jgi:hypothetical protein
MNVRWRGMRSRGPSSMGANVRWRARAVGGCEEMDIEGNQQMDMDIDDNKHAIENGGAEVTDEHETGDSTASGSGHRSRRRSHAAMPSLVSDSEDGKTVIIPTSDG